MQIKGTGNATVQVRQSILSGNRKQAVSQSLHATVSRRGPAGPCPPPNTGRGLGTASRFGAGWGATERRHFGIVNLLGNGVTFEQFCQQG